MALVLTSVSVLLGCSSTKRTSISLISPKLKRSVDVVDIIEAPHKEDEELLPSNDDGQPKSFDFVVVDKYKRNHKVYK